MTELKITEINRFMGVLLKSEAFDGFLLREGLVRTYMDFSFDGAIQTDYFDTDEVKSLQKYVQWGKIREHIFDLIKGKKTPLLIKLSLVAEDHRARELMTEQGVNISDTEQLLLSMNITYQKGEMRVVTGAFRSTFTIGHDMDHAWDEWVTENFKKMGIATE